MSDNGGFQFSENNADEIDVDSFIYMTQRPSFLTKTLNCKSYNLNQSLTVNLSNIFSTVKNNITLPDILNLDFSRESHAIAMPLHILVALIAAIGFLGNALLYLMMTYSEQKKSTYSLLVRATSVFDTLNLLFETPRTWKDLMDEIPLFLCDIISFVGIFTKTISSYFLILSTCDKLIMISNPLRWRIICNNSKIRRCIILIIVLSFGIAVGYICMVRIFSYCFTAPIIVQNCWNIIAFGSSSIDIISYCLLYSISFIPCCILAVMNSVSLFFLVVHLKEVKKISRSSFQKVPYVGLIVLTVSSFLSFIPFVFLDLIAFGYGIPYEVFYLIYVLQFADKFYILLLVSSNFRNSFYNILKSATKVVIESFVK